jgi:lysophospholipase L1-like esterase
MASRLFRALLAGSVVINCAGAAYGVYRLIARSKEHAIGYAPARTSQLKTLAVTRGSLDMLGDSLTDWGEWNELLPNANALNRGVSGDTLDELHARVEPLVRPKPRRLALMIGINDLSEGRSPETIATSYARLLERIRTLTPETVIFVQSVLPVNQDLYRGGIDNDDVNELNRRLKTLARQSGCRWVDVASSLADGAGQLDRKHTLDGLHLNGSGYQRWAKLLAASL